MKSFLILLLIISTSKIMSKDYNKLTSEEKRVILDKGTESPYTGKYYEHKEKGTYVCKQCGAKLYKSDDKFSSNCGWPSFDDEIKGAVKRIPDADGRRIEIVCANCDGHLGHVFEGEGFTEKDTRHCVNSISLEFVPKEKDSYETAIFAGGCFWGVEHLMEKQTGVIYAESVYIGGNTDDPNYKEVCSSQSGHAEAVKIVFDPTKTNYETLARYFFEIHDPTQEDGQGPDIGDQYRSEIFYTSDKQKEVTEKLIRILMDKGYKVVTKLTKASKFFSAEDFHQNYYKRKGTLPYCHAYQKKF
jgi:peptide methionine sulfoxide reductase msrA/msrB